MEDGESPAPPFWQSPATITRRQRRRTLPPIFNSSLFTILLPCFSLIIFVFFVVPSIPKILPQIHKPNSPLTTPSNSPSPRPISVKKGWDTLNIVLVVFAILCGVFARRNDDVPVSVAESGSHDQSEEQRISGDQSQRSKSLHHHHHHQDLDLDLDLDHDQNHHLHQHQHQHQSSAGSQQWYGFPEQRIYAPSLTPPVTEISRLRRTVSEMPQARDSGWETGNDRLRYFDDFDVSKFYTPALSHVSHCYHHVVLPEVDQIESEIIDETPVDALVEEETPVDAPVEEETPVDTFVLETRDELPLPTLSPLSSPPPEKYPEAAPPSPPPQSPSASPSPPPPEANDEEPTRTFQTLPRRERAPPPPPPPPPPPTPPRPEVNGVWGEKKKRNSHKKINAKKEIANAIALIYGKNRKRKRKQKSNPINEDPSPSPSPVESHAPPPPPPPPPPVPPSSPPPSVFHNLFRKGSSKTKKVHSLSSIPTPPPPPPAPRRSSAGKPPLPARPVKAREYYERDEIRTASGNQSPAIPTPPPPPTPPVKVAEMRYSVRGGYADESTSSEVNVMNGGDEERERSGARTSVSSTSSSMASVTCPASPDVNAKADTFIARLHNGWRLEKMNSWREKQ